MLSVIMLTIVLLSVVMLSAVAPTNKHDLICDFSIRSTINKNLDFFNHILADFHDY